MSKKKEDLLAQILALDAREAERLDEVWAESGDQADEIQALYGLARELENAPPARPSPTFLRFAQARLMAKLPDQQTVTFAGNLRLLWQRFTFYPKRRTAMTWMMILAILFAALAGGGGAAYASADTLPGDALYPVKMTIEAAQLGLADEQEDLSLYLTFADRRLDEVEALIRQERFGDLAVAVSGYQEQLAQIERLRMEAGPFGEAYGEMQAEKIRTRLELHMRRLLDLEDDLPSGAMQQVRMMNQALQRLQSEGDSDQGQSGGNESPGGAGPGGSSPQTENAPGGGNMPGDGQPDGSDSVGPSTQTGPGHMNQDGSDHEGGQGGGGGKGNGK